MLTILRDLAFFKALAWSMGQYCDSWFCFPAFKNDGSPKLALREEFADPGLLYAGKTWYAYGTNNIERGGTPKVNVQIAVSRDFQAWERVESMDMLPKLGAWAHKSNPKVWAPDVYQIVSHPGPFMTFFTLTFSIVCLPLRHVLFRSY